MIGNNNWKHLNNLAFNSFTEGNVIYKLKKYIECQTFGCSVSNIITVIISSLSHMGCDKNLKYVSDHLRSFLYHINVDKELAKV
ncbi:hypothetical protein EWB00_008989 [Schistosoma japonicum]|uniref:Uncharacterized protein n=1 Tax=Schistosoma japonicum TaxID=6182 RepID=A0A4Z2CN60_SCHJA|nr:hypothetical protein EWB00_008989 [Schistosoma japonicum]